MRSIDPYLLADEIVQAADEFNRLTALASVQGLDIEARLLAPSADHGPPSCFLEVLVFGDDVE